MRVHDAPGPLDHGKGGWCPDCHLAWTEGQAAHCSGCCVHFSSDSAFDLHHTLDETGRTVCHDPATLHRRNGRPKLVLRDGVWGWPGEDPRRGQNPAQNGPTAGDAGSEPSGRSSAAATRLSTIQQTLGEVP
jgi:hypothetical protein